MNHGIAGRKLRSDVEALMQRHIKSHGDDGG
jgi:hypothetical protein